MVKEKVSIVIPCYNEEEGIAYLAQQLAPAVASLEQQYAVELIFVDDGSKDKTHELLHQHFGMRKDTIIIKHQQNKNLGAALRTGFAQATGDYIAALDSDCTYSPQLLSTMLPMLDSQTDIVTVSPYHPLGKVNNVPAYRIFLSKGASRLYRLALRSNIYTYTAMVRVYKKDVLNNVSFKKDNFLGVTELFVKSLLQGYRAKELPAELNVRKFGQSKMKMLPVRIIKDHLSLLSQVMRHKLFRKEL